MTFRDNVNIYSSFYSLYSILHEFTRYCKEFTGFLQQV